MDRRPLKTKTAIYHAFIQLINQKAYDTITVQEIINLANVGRSTFYTHFESKEILLEYLCQDLFHHIFVQTERFSSLEEGLSHIFYHFKENQDKVATLLVNRNPYFIKRFRQECYAHLFPHFVTTMSPVKQGLDSEFLSHFVSSLIIDSLDWWLHQRQKMPETELVHHILTLIT